MAQQAILTAQRETEERKLAQLDNEALLLGLLDQPEGVVPQVLRKLDVDPALVRRELLTAIEQSPKLQYSGEPAVSGNFRKALQQAEAEARQFGDEYISTEHLLLGILSVPNSPAAKLLARFGVTRDRVLQALTQIRGSQRVTDANPEGKYAALEKYGRDLTELAR
jgi:ATP-dependent Clp protease ATP-binding subunit ClpB